MIDLRTQVENHMVSRSAITKVEVFFIIDVIVVAVAIGSYFYLQNTGELAVGPRPAEFAVVNLTINPLEADIGEPILISANVTNVGDEEGNYSAYLTINDVLEGNQTLLLSAGASDMVEFTVIETAEGNYTAKIGDLSGFFKIKATSPTTSMISLSNLFTDPYEAWIGDSISITATATNIGITLDSLSVKLMIDGSLIETKTVQLATGEATTVGFTYNATAEGTHSVAVNSLTGTFYIVPTGYHTLLARYSGGGSTPMPFTLDGASYTMPYTELLPVGTHTATVPMNVETRTALFQFMYWGDGDTSMTKVINLQNRTLLVVTYKLVSGYACCPSLSIWNGTNYVYRTEVSSGTGYLPYFEYFGENGTMVFGYSDPWDYIKLDNNQIQPRNGYYDMTLTEMSDEIFYLDSARLLVVDHSPDVNVYSTGWTRKYNLDGQGSIYTVNKTLSTPISAVYNGENVLPQISNLDGTFAAQSNWQYGQWNTLELNLGNMTDAKEIKLLVNGMVVWPTSDVTAEWVANFATQPGVEPFPVQYMEVKGENGSWVRVSDNRQFPMLDAAPETFAVNLTGLFPTNDYSLRIHMFFDGRIDYIGVDTTSQQDVTVQQLHPSSATLTQIFETYSTSTGNFTSYGDVTQLMLEADDEFVIGRRGDEIHLLFPADVKPVPEGMERDYFVFVSCWFKLPGLPYMPFTVDPLPFHAMSAYPYPPTESYPYDEAHLSYLLEYNTRTVPSPDVEAPTNDSILGQNIPLLPIIIELWAIPAMSVATSLRKRRF
jgi:hypothetical protein